MRSQPPGKNTNTMDNHTNSTPYSQQSFSTTLLLKHGRSNTSPIRTMTNGSIMNNSNINRFYHSLPTSPGTEVNGNLPTTTVETPGGVRFEVPLPFGYHLDLDFLRVCSEELVSGENLQKLKELKKQRRKQRKTLEALMGIKQDQKDKEKQRILQDMPPSMSPIMKKKSPPTTLKLSQPDIIHSSELVREALRESMLNFQETLDQYKDEGGDITNFDLICHGISSTPDPKKSSKFATFPRPVRSLGSPGEEIPGNGKLSRQLSNSSISSISTSSSALPYNTSLTPEAYLASLPSTVMPNPDEMETNSIGSISSEMSTATLRNVREQMARSLAKLKEYEKQVEAIPVLQVKLSVLKEEKRLLMLKLKAWEAKLRRERGEIYESDGAFDSIAFDEEMDTDDEDLDTRVAKMSNSLARKYSLSNQNQRRARSESPYAKCGMVHPEDFISFQRKRSTSCGFNSDSSDISPSGGRKYYTQDSPEFAARKGRFSRGSEPQKITPPIETRELGVNTDLLPEVKAPVKELVMAPPQVSTRERGANTDPPPKSPPPPRKVHKGANTLSIRSIPKGMATELKMSEIISRDELESKIQDAVFRTEEEIMSCPLLQKAMQKVEEEALKGPEPEKEFLDTACQVGLENLRPFVIDTAILCKLDGNTESKPMADSWCQVSPAPVPKLDASCGLTIVERMALMRSVGVGECRVIEEPKEPNKLRTVGVVTEKWVEVIKASKQTDTDDFAYKDTESPRVADMTAEAPSEQRDRIQRLSSLTSPCLRNSMSPSVSRRSSTNSPSISRKSSAASTARAEQMERVDQRSQGTMTELEMKVKVATKDAKVETERKQTRTASTSALVLPLTKSLPPGSPLSTPETEKPPVSLNLCDKCDKDILQVAEGIISGPPLSPVIAPPSPDMPWVSKIPRPCPMENPEVARLKGATSTGNLSIGPRSQSPGPVQDRMQRSKSNLEPSPNSRYGSFGYGSSRTPPPQRRDMGTPPPHPKSPAPVGSKRAPSPLARSPGPSMSSSYSAPSADKKSLIPKFSPSFQRKTPGDTPKTSTPTSPLAESKSFIPRVVTPPALRKMFPKTPENKPSGSSLDKNAARKQTYSRGQAGVTNPDLDKIEEHPRKETMMQQMKRKISDIKEKLSGGESDSGDDTETLDDTDGPKKSTSSYPLPGSALFAPIDDNRKKVEPSKEMKGALKVLNDSLSRGALRSNAQVTNAVNIIQQEWFKTSSTKQSNPLDVEEYLDSIEEMSRDLLDQVVNLADVNGNTALHYSVSHGNFDVVSILLDSKVANANILNKAGYTCSMLISLAVISNDSHRAVVKKLFSISDLNLRASQHGQTALMLAVSHGRLDMVQLLTEAGADLNIRDEDGSTALMCAAEHGHLEIVKLLMQHPDINIGATDNDGLTALTVAMEAGHRDIGVLLYANMSFSRGTSPHSSIRMKKSSSRNSMTTPSQGSTPVPPAVSSPIPPTPPHRSRRNSSN